MGVDVASNVRAQPVPDEREVTSGSKGGPRLASADAMSAANRSIRRLVDGGDWACSWGEPTGLQEVCDELGALLEPALAVRASKISRLAAADMAAASRQWRDLVSMLAHIGRVEAADSARQLR